MHELLHVTILVATVVGAGALGLLAFWPLLSNAPLSSGTRWLLGGLAGVAGLLFLVEWLIVH